MKIYVGTWQQMLILEIEQSDTIATVKSKIQDREGFPAEQQRIFVNDVELDDSVRVAGIVVRDDLFWILAMTSRSGCYRVRR